MPVKVQVMCVETGAVFDSLTEAAAYSGISIQSISHSCGEGVSAGGMHYKRINGNGRLTTKERLRRNKRMRKDHDKGMSIGDIAAKYGLTYQAARNAIFATETDARRRRSMSERKRRDKNILKEHEAGATYRQLMDKYGLCKSSIELCLKRARTSSE